MALVSILRRFKFETASDTEVDRTAVAYCWYFEENFLSPQAPLQTRLGITLGPVNGIHLKLVARD